MHDWTKILVAPATPIKQAIETLDRGALRIVLVVDAEHRLLGTVTDGDVRRGLLRSVSLDTPVTEVMNASPTTAGLQLSRTQKLQLMQRRGLYQLPILDESGTVVGLEIIDDLIEATPLDNWVAIMAGGLGMRLRPLTDERPKPLLEVGNKPVLETVLDSFVEQGFRRFYISVNYKAEMIREHFGDGRDRGIEIRYIQEKQKLGTAGALSLLPTKPTQALIVMNGDILTKVDFRHLLDFHAETPARE